MARPAALRFPRARAAEVVVPVLASLAYAIFAWRHILAHPLSRSQSTGGEEGIYLWYLGHAPWAVLHGSNPFVTNAINFPQGVNLLWNTSLLTPGLILAPITELGGVLLTYNLALVITLWLSVLTAYFACRRFVEWWPAALVGGAMVAISPYLSSQSRGHLNLVLIMLPPLFLLVGHELVVRQRTGPVRLGLLLALLVVLQVGLSTEILASTGALAILGVIVAALLHPRQMTPQRVRYVGKAVAVAVVASALVLAVPAYYLLFGAQHLSGPAQASDRFREDLLSPVVPTAVQKLSPEALVRVSSRFSGNGFENTGYLGVTLLALVVGIVVVLRRRPVVRWAAVVALLSFVLSLGPRLSVNGRDTGIPLPFRALNALPLFSSGTAVRYSYYTFLLCALLVSIGCDRARAAAVLRRGAPAGTGPRGFVPALAMTAAVVVALVPLVPAVVPFRATNFAVPGYFTGSGPESVQAVPQGSVLLAYPYLNRFESEPMTWQALADFRYRQIGDYAITPGKDGKGVFDVQTAAAYVEHLIGQGRVVSQTSTPARAMRLELRSWGVRTVVVDLGSANAAGAVAFFTQMLGRPPTMTGGVARFTGFTV